MKDLKDYIALIKFKYHTSFLAIVLIALFFSPQLSINLARQLLLLYLSFNILLYTGLYTINDVADLGYDRQHPLKRNRPIPSGRISIREAVLLSTLLIASGLLTGWLFFGTKITGLYMVFIFLNMAYSFIAKHIPYVEIAMNTITHPLRAVMAFVFIGQPVQPLLLVAYTFFISGIMIVRRVVEKDISGWETRRALSHYGQGVMLGINAVSLLALVLLAAFDERRHLSLYAIMLLIYIPIVFGMYRVSFIRSLLRLMLTK